MRINGGQRVQSRSPLRQRGVALITALIFLLILTIQSVAGMHAARLETRMAVNSQLQAAALNNAELAISHAVADLQAALATGRDFAASGDHFFNNAPGSAGSIDSMALDWSTITAATVPVAPDTRYFIVYTGCHAKPGHPGACNNPVVRCPLSGACAHVYTITARSNTGQGATRTVQSTLVLDTGPAGSGIGSGRHQVKEVISGLRIWTDLLLQPD